LLPLWLLAVVVPLYFVPSAKDPFRLPKLMLAEWLAIASLVPLAWALRRVEVVRWRDLWGQPAIRALLPLLAVATAGLATSAHPLHVRAALADLWIGAACLVGWSAALPARRLERVLVGLLLPAAALAVIGILQFHGLQPLAVAPALGGARYTVTSTAGNTGDFAAFLVLPCLVAQWRLARGAAAVSGGSTAAGGSAGERDAGGGRRRLGRRWGWLAAALVLCAYAVAVTQTLAALVALLLGSLTFWFGSLRRGGAGLRWLAAACAAAALLAVGAVAAVPALRGRVAEKVSLARRGEWNHVLTGRLDGWRTALWMLERHPWAGVGQGAFRAEFVPAKLALLDRGAAFLSGEQQNFVNAHDEPLEVGADLGVPGLLALAWALVVVTAAARLRMTAAAPGMPRAPAGGGASQVPSDGAASRLPATGAASRAPAGTGASRVAVAAGASRVATAAGASQASAAVGASQVATAAGASQAPAAGGASRVVVAAGGSQAPAGAGASRVAVAAGASPAPAATGASRVAVAAGASQAPASGGDPDGGPAHRALGADGAFAAAGLVALGVLCLVDFPFRVALVAFPALLFLAWVLRPAAAEAAA
jgi:O-Antigen ligase